MPRITESQLCGRDIAPLVTLAATPKYESFKEMIKHNLVAPLKPLFTLKSGTHHFAWFPFIGSVERNPEKMELLWRFFQSLMTQVTLKLVFFDLGESGDCIQLSCFDWGV